MAAWLKFRGGVELVGGLLALIPAFFPRGIGIYTSPPVRYSMKPIDFELPSLEPRLQRRFRHLVQAHLQVSPAAAPGVKALPGAASAFASTQAAWRFFNNPSVSLPGLAEPLLAHARR